MLNVIKVESNIEIRNKILLRLQKDLRPLSLQQKHRLFKNMSPQSKNNNLKLAPTIKW
jgi:hypothetical protein